MVRFYILFLAVLLSVSMEAAVGHMWLAKVDYELSYSGFESEELDLMPKQQTMLVNGSNTRRIMSVGDTKTYVIGNADSSLLINMSENEVDCMATLCDSADIAWGRSTLQIVVTPLNESRNILGYPCHGYEVSIRDTVDEQTYNEEIWTTDYIGGERLNFYLYPEVKGCVLYSKKTDGTRITISRAKKVSKQTAIPARSFLPPSDCVIESCR